MLQTTCKICTCKSVEACTNVHALVMWIVLLASAELPGDWKCQRMMPESVQSSNCVCHRGDNGNVMPTWSSHPLEKRDSLARNSSEKWQGLTFTEKEQVLERESKGHWACRYSEVINREQIYQYGVRYPKRTGLLSSCYLFPSWHVGSTEGKEKLYLSQATASLHSYCVKMSLCPPPHRAVLQFQCAWVTWEM